MYNAWFDMPEDPHNMELDKLRSEVETTDLILDIGGSVTGVTRDTVLGRGHDDTRLGVVSISQCAPAAGQTMISIYSSPSTVFTLLLQSLGLTKIPSTPRNICCLHLASALVPYDSKGKRSDTERMLLNLEVGARVKLASGHDHKLIPGYSLVSGHSLTQVQRDKLSSSGPKYGSVTRVCPDKCAYEVKNI